MVRGTTGILYNLGLKVTVFDECIHIFMGKQHVWLFSYQSETVPWPIVHALPHLVFQILCIYLVSYYLHTQIHGWGLNEDGNFSETLLTAQIPYISYSKCVRIAESDFKESVTLDKFCAGTETGMYGAFSKTKLTSPIDCQPSVLMYYMKQYNNHYRTWSSSC